jgi:serine/arginine repetitive matrix protein 2
MSLSRHASTASSATPVTDDHVGMGQTMGPGAVEQRAKLSMRATAGFPGFSDVPEDLLAIVGAGITTALPPPSPNKTATLGLPPPPPLDRISPRRPARAAPAISLPPLPDEALANGPSRISPIPPHISLEFARDGQPRDSVLSDILSATGDFDFTSEYAALDRGEQRSSFLAAAQHFGGSGLMGQHMSMDSDLQHFTSTRTLPTIEQSPDSNHTDTASYDESSHSETEESGAETETEREIGVQHNLEQTAASVETSRPAAARSERPKPFQGQLAFQQRMSAAYQQPMLALPSPTVEVVPQSTMLAPADALPVPAPARRRTHRRDESGLSIATMSSIGAVIETDIAGDYTNYFEVNFKQHLDHQRQLSVGEVFSGLDVPTDAVSPRHFASSESVSSANEGTSDRRAPTRRGHHRRNSSIVSTESIPDFSIVKAHGPPVSLHNRRRSSYISKHRRSGSGDSGWGRADWASHQRNSTDSVVSNISVSRLARPSLGDRMFQLDGGVQLTSITGSPPDDVRPMEGSGSIHARSPSLDSIFSGETPQTSFDSMFDTSIDHSRSTSTSSDSIFGATSDHEAEQAVVQRGFFLKGMRPVSEVSMASSENPDDTFINVAKYGRRWNVKADETPLEADGEGGLSSESSPRGVRSIC